MADNKLELIVEVDAGKANASIKSINTNLSAMEQATAKAGRTGASSINSYEDALSALKNTALGAVQSLGALGAGILVAGSAIAGLATSSFMAAKSLGEYGDRISDTAIRMGITNREVSQLSFAMKRAGGDISSVEVAIRMLSKGLDDTS